MRKSVLFSAIAATALVATSVGFAQHAQAAQKEWTKSKPDLVLIALGTVVIASVVAVVASGGSNNDEDDAPVSA